jgi:hypothetical protein
MWLLIAPSKLNIASFRVGLEMSRASYCPSLGAAQTSSPYVLHYAAELASNQQQYSEASYQIVQDRQVRGRMVVCRPRASGSGTRMDDAFVVVCRRPSWGSSTMLCRLILIGIVESDSELVRTSGQFCKANVHKQIT